MLPVIALVGRPNVGKSTLFNRLTRSREALVADHPGLTRDRKYGLGRLGDRPYLVVDTGGLSGEEAGLDALMARQAWRAVEEADAVIFLVDAREGLTAADEAIAARLRRTGKRVWLAVNKTDGLDPELVRGDFFALGLGEPWPIAAVHGRGVRRLVDRVLAELPRHEPPPEGAEGEAIRIALIGRPNVGKSTLLNRILGEERVVAYDQPGTTRDTIEVPFERDGQPYLLMDTAGVRRRARIEAAVEKYSVIKALQAMEAAHVVILLIDAREGVVDQDATLAGLAAESGRAIILAVNKWDGLDAEHKARVKAELERRLPFLEYADRHFISALHGTGVGHLFDSVQRAWASARAHFATPRLTALLQEAVARHPPPLVRGRRIKLRYAHQGGRNPPVIVVHGNQTEKVPQDYRRYLVNFFRERLGLVGTPLRIEFRSGENPYAGRRNRLTPRQLRKRRRLERFVRRGRG
ncbi:MAG: ribosome biogenesis GTPase Der [Gammaproteobacteria bacterium]|nr:MAG: ribosome biogenesis GTPase Der [Gammaproteobacteria bacterium]